MSGAEVVCTLLRWNELGMVEYQMELEVLSLYTYISSKLFYIAKSLHTDLIWKKPKLFGDFDHEVTQAGGNSIGVNSAEA